MSRHLHTTAEIEIGDQPVEVEITYSISPYWPATRHQPAEGGEVELVSVTRAGVEIELTDQQEAEVLEKVEANARQDLAEHMAEAAEARAEARLEAEWCQP